jgi:Asp-tRNA(Asn)/Glu-tRNA(Gln) amidotransferase A subunit family amidase
MSPPWALAAGEVAARIRAGTLSAADYASACLARAEALEPELRAYVELDPARVLAAARALDARIAAGEDPGPLAGLPIGVKDIIDCAGRVTGCGSPLRAGHVARADAALVARATAAGGYAFGKTVTTEFAFMHPRDTRNPWNRAHTPGGSSSGSAAAVASGSVPLAWATQTNGSVIRPAAYCGIVGYKPSLGALPMDGVLSCAPTLDQPGCYGRRVADAALLAACVANRGYSIPRAVPAPSRAPQLLLALTPVGHLASEAMRAELARVAELLRSAGARVEPRELPESFGAAHAAHRAIMGHEAARWFAPLRADPARRALLSEALNAYLDEAARIDEADYRAALATRAALRADWAAVLAEHDALLTPPAPGVAPAGIASTGDPSFCTIWTLLGAPALTLPCALGPGALPLGIQLVASECDDERLLAVAGWCEARLGFHASAPPAA